MGYVVDVRRFNPQEGISNDILLRRDRVALNALRELNSTAAEMLELEWFQDPDGLNLPTIMYSTMANIATNRKPRRWDITISAHMLGTRSQLCALSMNSSGANVLVAAASRRPRTDCPTCWGHGSMRLITGSRESECVARMSSGALAAAEVRTLLPGPIIKSHHRIAKTIDEMRGRGKFDALLKHVEARLISLRRSLFVYSINVEARTILSKCIVQACLGRIGLPPLLYVGNKNTPASSRWEATQIAGKNFPVQVPYFHACPACLGIGMRCG